MEMIMLLFMVLAIKMMFTLTHCRHLNLAVNWVRDEPAKGKSEDLHVGDK